MQFLNDEALECDNGDGYSSEEIPIMTSRKRILPPSSESESDHDGRNGSILEGLPLRKRSKQCDDANDDNDLDDVEENLADGNDVVLNEIKKTNQILLGLSVRMRKTEKSVKTMEEKLNSGAASSGTPKSSRKKDVPQEVRVSLYNNYYEQL